MWQNANAECVVANANATRKPQDHYGVRYRTLTVLRAQDKRGTQTKEIGKGE
ncbi:MAG: hypothetical protein LIR46_00650 [Bacteroidota bacterium]|nr:hypothetical protein [Bacteroidota bacterium]